MVRAAEGVEVSKRDKPKPTRARVNTPATGPGHGGPANGPGWGGPANGLNRRFSAEHQPDPAAVAAGIAEAKTAAAAARPHAVSMVEVWRTIALDADAPAMARIVAAEKLVDRAEGKPAQTMNLRRINDFADLTEEELAALARGGKDGE